MLTSVLIVAAGRGQRLGGTIPKQYLPIAGVCVLRRAVEAFLAIEAVDIVRVVIHPDDRPLCDGALATLNDPRLLDAVPGGNSRAQSVLLGLESLCDHAPDRVLIHDAARPFVPGEVVTEVIRMLDKVDAVFAALPVVDAIWSVEDSRATTAVPREGLWRAQTPQGFRFDRILAAHRSFDGEAADDVAVARAAGLDVRIVPGSEDNFKITTAADLERAEMLHQHMTDDEHGPDVVRLTGLR